MTYTQPTTNAALFTLALLSFMFGMVLCEMLLFVDQIPAWGLLPAFFGTSVLCKFILTFHKQMIGATQQVRVVTVEFDWNLGLQEVRNGHYG
ncbi:MAG: hypothetical protein KDE58_24605 [Caldilineaceae bacterium]|nr:hypothetical protein [Caldilineaceae bacterium]